MVVRTGADPTLEGGGEFARETDADVMDALSDNISLTGVPDLSNRETEARLGWREGKGSPGGCIELADEGADTSALEGTSAFGVGNTLKVFGAFRIAGDETLAEAGVLGGKAGKSDGTGCLEGVSPPFDVASVSFADCVARLRVGKVVAVVDLLVVDLGPEGVATGVEVALGCLLTTGVAIAGLLEATGFIVRGSFGLPGSSDGKSSGCKAGPWAGMAFDKPVLAAEDLTSRFACAAVGVALGAVGVGGTETVAKGVAARGTYEELAARDGVKGADVGTIFDAALPTVSSFRPEFKFEVGWA